SQVEFDPSGTRLLISSWFGKAQVWDLASGKSSSPPFGPKEGLSMAAFSPDGKRVVTASEAGTASVWDATSGAEIFSMKHPDRVMSARYSADGQWIVTACKDKCARIFNATNGQLVRDLGDHADLVFDAAFSPDGQWLVTASRDSTAQIWNAKTGERHGPALQHNNWVFSAAFSPDGRRIVTSCYDRYARIWDVATFAEVHPSLAHADAVRSARFSPDGRRIVTASWDLTVRIWDAATGQLQKPNGILRHTGRGVMHASFAPDARRIATGCIDGTTRVWDLAGGENLAESLEGIIAENAPVLLQTYLSRIDLISLQDPDQSLARIEVGEPIKAAGLSRNGEFVLALLGSQATSRVASLHIWNSKMGRALYAPSNCREEFHQLNLSHDGKRLVIHSGKELRLVALATGVETRLDLPHAIDWTVFSPDDHRILAVCGTEIQIIDVTSARPISKPLQHALPVKWAQFSPDTQCIVAATGDNTLNEGMAVLWSADGKRLANLEHKDGVLKIAFSPDSRRVITCSEDFTARIWEIPSGAPLTGRLLHEHQVHDAVFSADGLWVVTASADRTARLWDAQSGEPVSPPLFHDAPLGKAWFSGEGQQILTRDLRGKLWRWRIGSETNGIADLQRLARFLTGYAFQNSLSPSGSLEKDWQYLRTRMPNLFQNAGIDRIKSWHQREIASAKSRKDASAAAFHQQILDAMNTVRAE
ncbi:MAG: WD40 repeat domain-containing protein, partial [Verrucomicrobiota bacterium]